MFDNFVGPEIVSATPIALEMRISEMSAWMDDVQAAAPAGSEADADAPSTAAEPAAVTSSPETVADSAPATATAASGAANNENRTVPASEWPNLRERNVV